MFESGRIILSLAVVTVLCVAASNDQTIKHVKLLDTEALSSVYKSQGVKCLYFFQKDLPQIRQFLKEYEKSAKAIKPYGVEFFKADCNVDKTLGSCREPDSSNKIYIYRDGRELLDLGLDTMFDVNAILSNVLQVLLLNEVPIVQNLKNRISREGRAVGKRDIIFSYQKAIGTYEHRILMEVAYAYSDRYSFMISTDATTAQDLPGYDTTDECAVWLLPCSSVPTKMKKLGCHQMAVKYSGSVDLPSLARFVRVLELHPIHDVIKDGMFNPYEENDMNTVYIFYDTESHKQVLHEAEELAINFRGIVGFIMVDVGHSDPTQFGYEPQWNIPALAVKKLGQADLHSMPSDASPEEFISEVLQGDVRHTGVSHRDMRVSEDDLMYEGDGEEEWSLYDDTVDRDSLSEVEIQDDRVAEAVSRMKDIPVDVTHMPALTDVTFTSHTSDGNLRMVLFYLAFDARGAAFLRSFSQASLELWEATESEPLATVNCYDWTDVCAKVNITSYPVLRVYRPDREWVPYLGMLSASAVVHTIRLYQLSCPSILQSPEDVAAFITGPSPITAVTDVSVVGLFSSQDTQGITTFNSAAEVLHGKVAFGLVMDGLTNDIMKQAGINQLPAVIVYKRHDLFQPHLTLPLPSSSEELVSHVLQGRLPVLPELTAENYPAYHARGLPFVILFTGEASGKLYSTLGKLAVRTNPDVSFAWMKLGRGEMLSEKILTFYIEGSLPGEALVLVSHSKGAVYVYDDVTLASEDHITQWISKASQGQIPPTKHLEEKEWKPRHPGYDFLALMDEDRQRGPVRMEEEAEEEYDEEYGFDSFTENERPGDAAIRGELQGLRNSRLFHKAPFKSHAGQPPVRAEHPDVDKQPWVDDVPSSREDASYRHKDLHVEL